MLKLNISKLDELFAEIAKQQSLYLPVDKQGGVAEFEKWESGKKLSGALNTTRSAKDFFFPQTENLVDFKVKGKNIDIIDTRSESENFVIFGVRPCDARSFAILDRVFLADPVDSYYQNRREHGTIISLACTDPAETCFCGTFDIDPTEPEGDIAAWLTEKNLFLDAKTARGEDLLSKLSGLLENVSDADLKELQAEKQSTREVMQKLPLEGLTTDGFGAGLTMELFDSKEWEELSSACLGCGTCTFVCPTCQCYDIKDFDTGDGIKRFRCWDSCMYSDFTMCAHGNPRTSQLERFRQRFMHKLVYYPEKNDGLFSCVGCGRCLAKCPISMNIVKVMREVGGMQNG